MSKYNDISNGRVILDKKINESYDTQIFLGRYYGMDCTIKKIKIDNEVGIKSKILRELSFLKKYKHKNIIKLYGVCHDDENIYIILERGKFNLLSAICIELCFDIFDDIISGLSFIENNGYLHGDLNLKNIMLFESSNGNFLLKLIDFGLTTKIYRKSAVKKPALFIEPIEMQKGLDIHPDKIDSWSFGCIKYFLKTKKMVTLDTITEVTEKNKGTNIMLLLEEDPKKRLTIVQYSEKIGFNREIAPKIDKKYYSIFIHKKEVLNVNKKRVQLINTFLFCNTVNSVPVENIFLTMKLLEKVKYKNDDEYIKNAMILFYLTTKLVSTNEVSSLETMKLTNSMMINKNYHFLSLKNFHECVINLLFNLDWNIDVDTQVNYIQDISENLRIRYLVISLIILFSDELLIFTNEFMHKIIMNIIDPSQSVYRIDESNFLEKKILSKILEEIKNVNNKDNYLYQSLTTYLRSIREYDLLDSILVNRE